MRVGCAEATRDIVTSTRSYIIYFIMADCGEQTRLKITQITKLIATYNLP